MSINVTSTQAVTPVNTNTSSTAGVAKGALASREAQKDDSDKRTDAANVELSASARALSAAAALSDPQVAQAEADLIREIKDRVSAGTFEIDYQQIATNMLRDALAQARAPKGGPAGA